MEAGTIKVRRAEDPRDVYEERTLARRMRGAAAGQADDLADQPRRRPWVTPVVVVWAPFEQQAVEQDGVWWIHGKALQEWS